MPMLKVRNNSTADIHLTPPVPPPPAPGDPLVPAIPGVIIPRCSGTPGLPDHKPGIIEISSEAIEACAGDPVVRSWFSGDSPRLEILGGIAFPPPPAPRARRAATAANGRDAEKDALKDQLAQRERDSDADRKRIRELEQLLDAKTKPAPADTTKTGA